MKIIYNELTRKSKIHAHMNNSQDLLIRDVSSKSSSSSLPTEKFFFVFFCCCVFINFSFASLSDASSESELCANNPRVCWLPLFLLRLLGLVFTIMYCCSPRFGIDFDMMPLPPSAPDSTGFSSGIVVSLYMCIKKLHIKWQNKLNCLGIKIMSRSMWCACISKKSTKRFS